VPAPRVQDATPPLLPRAFELPGTRTYPSATSNLARLGLAPCSVAEVFQETVRDLGAGAAAWLRPPALNPRSSASGETRSCASTDGDLALSSGGGLDALLPLAPSGSGGLELPAFVATDGGMPVRPARNPLAVALEYADTDMEIAVSGREGEREGCRVWVCRRRVVVGVVMVFCCGHGDRGQGGRDGRLCMGLRESLWFSVGLFRVRRRGGVRVRAGLRVGVGAATGRGGVMAGCGA
jgi:hypothetical protein